MSRPRRTFFAILALAIVGVALLLTGRKMFEEMQALREPPPPGAADGGTGSVRFADGAPAPGARVHAELVHDGATELVEIPTGPDGRFAVPAGATGLRAEFGPFAAAPSSGADFALPATSVVAGLVQTGRERRAVAGATVRLGALRATTDADGAFRFEGVTAGDCAPLPVRIVVEAAGYAALEHTIPADARAAAYGDLALRVIPLE